MEWWHYGPVHSLLLPSLSWYWPSDKVSYENWRCKSEGYHTPRIHMTWGDKTTEPVWKMTAKLPLIQAPQNFKHQSRNHTPQISYRKKMQHQSHNATWAASFFLEELHGVCLYPCRDLVVIGGFNFHALSMKIFSPLRDFIACCAAGL